MAIGNADRGGVEDRGVPEQHLVDLARRDVLAALDDELLDAAGDEEEAVGIANADVAERNQPSGRNAPFVAASFL